MARVEGEFGTTPAVAEPVVAAIAGDSLRVPEARTADLV
jgi:hypothetical protein